MISFSFCGKCAKIERMIIPYRKRRQYYAGNKMPELRKNVSG